MTGSKEARVCLTYLECDKSPHYLYEIQVDLDLQSHTVSDGLVTVCGVELQLQQEVMTLQKR